MSNPPELSGYEYGWEHSLTFSSSVANGLKLDMGRITREVNLDVTLVEPQDIFETINENFNFDEDAMVLLGGEIIQFEEGKF
jgi:hypothetical protein